MKLVIQMKDTMAILRDKMQIVARDEQKNLTVVGPVKLPIKQGDFEATFQWYTWLATDVKDSKEDSCAVIEYNLI